MSFRFGALAIIAATIVLLVSVFIWWAGSTPEAKITAQLESTISNQQMSGVIGLAVTEKFLFISDSENAAIHLFDLSGGYLGHWPTFTSSVSLGRPTHIAAGRDGKLYVPDHLEDHVWVFGPDGTLATKFGEHGSGNGQFDSPTGVAIAGDGTIHVADFNNHRILQFDNKGQFIRTWGEKGHLLAGGLYYPTDVAIGPNGRVYVADAYNHRIQVFTSDGQHILTWGSKGPNPGEFNVAIGIAIDAQGRVYVADQFNHRVQVFTARGTFLGMWGKPGSSRGKFDRPNDIDIDAQGRVYVADFGNARVQIFAINEVVDR